MTTTLPSTTTTNELKRARKGRGIRQGRGGRVVWAGQGGRPRQGRDGGEGGEGEEGTKKKGGGGWPEVETTHTDFGVIFFCDFG